MSDGRTEAMRGTYFSGKSKVKHSEEYYDINRNRSSSQFKSVYVGDNKGDFKHMPNQKWHKIISFIKSGIRIIGYSFIPFSLVTATILLILSEIVGIVEELV
tara:strand:- start:73 stop:378 length:306 start_codon:yes stop_codon:yes gene_type:complete